MTKQELTDYCLSHGWTQDRWGHVKKGEYRIKLCDKVARYEKKYSSGWIRLRSGYYSKLSIVNDKISGMEH